MPAGSPSLDIAIAGCGIAGMAAAIFLRRAGHQITLFERFDTPRPVGAGLLLQPGGLHVLGRLGLLPQILAAGAPVDRLDGRAWPSGRRILDVGYRSLGDDAFGVGIHRAALFGALHDATLQSGAEIVTGATLTGMDRQADDRPVLRDKDGRRHGPFDLLVDASGAQSKLRTLLSGRAPRPFPYGALWTTVPLAGSAFDSRTIVQRYVRAERMIGVMPVGSVPGRDGAHAAFFWSLRMDRLAAWRDGGLQRFRAEVAAIWPEAARLLDGIDDPETLQPAFYAHYTARVPAAARLAVIGDAAHSTSPQLGQGANMALIDALVLAGSLAAAADLPSALARYVAERRAHVRFYQRASTILTALFQSDSRLAALARDGFFPPLHAVPYFRKQTTLGLAGLKRGLFRRLPAEYSGIG